MNTQRNAMTPERPKYLAYLLRLWETQDAQGPTWRASLEEVSTHTRRGFESVEKMMAFLREQVSSSSDKSAGPLAKREKE